MKLTKDRKDQITSRVVGLMFDAKEADQRKRMAELFDLVMDEWIGADQLKLIMKLEAGSLGELHEINVRLFEPETPSDFILEQRVAGRSRRTPNHKRYGCKFPTGTKIAEAVMQMHKDCDDLAEQKAAFQQEVRAILNAHQGMPKLLEAWPELKTIMPEGFFDIPKSLSLVVNFEGMREQVSAAYAAQQAQAA
jgi:hypothetical protein